MPTTGDRFIRRSTEVDLTEATHIPHHSLFFAVVAGTVGLLLMGVMVGMFVERFGGLQENVRMVVPP